MFISFWLGQYCLASGLSHHFTIKYPPSIFPPIYLQHVYNAALILLDSPLNLVFEVKLRPAPKPTVSKQTFKRHLHATVDGKPGEQDKHQLVDTLSPVLPLE